MLRKRKGWLRSFIVIALALSVVLSGCSSNKSKTSSASGLNVATTHVKIWTWSPIPSTMQKMIAAYEGKHSNIVIDYTNYNYSPQYLAALAAGSASNSLPDIVGMQPGALTQQYRSYLEPLNTYAQTAWGTNWKDKFYTASANQLTLGNPTGNNNVYCMPVESQVIDIWYNKTLFNKVGISVPTTWDKLISDSKALTSAGYAPMYQGAADGWQNENVFLMLAGQTAPGEIYTAEDGKSSWTSAGLVSAMTAWKGMFTSGIMQVGALSDHAYPDGVSLFTAGKVGMMALGSWWFQEYTGDNPPQTVKNWDFDHFYLPAVTTDGKVSPAVGGTDFGYSITKNSKNVDAAWQVIQSFTAEEGIQQAVNDMNDLPAFKGITTKITVPDSITTELKRYENDLEGAQSQRIKSPDVDNALQNALSGVAAGQLTPTAALQQIQTATNKVLGK
jgi:raffinose/stachyose/melibiose transport system substrate-binding protein